MFFRFYFLYAPKLACLFFAISFVSFSVAIGVESEVWAEFIAVTAVRTLFAIGLTGAATAAYLLFINRMLECPHCRAHRGEVVTYDNKPAIECDACGLVFVRNLLLDSDVTVIPWEEIESADGDD